MINKLIPVFREEYNTLQIVVKHEVHEEDTTGYYLNINLLCIDEANKKLKSFKTHARQIMKKAKKESSYDKKELEDMLKTYVESINQVFGVYLTQKDF